MEDGLQERMERLSRRQGLCLKVRAALAVLTLVWYELAAAVLPAHMAVVVLWGGPLSDRAAALARERYPGVPARVGVIGKGAGWDPQLRDEAGRLGDGLTVKLLGFGRRSLGIFLAAALGNAGMWVLAALRRQGA